MPELTYRQARLDDAAEIHALLLRLAPEIPLLADTLEREEALYAQIRTCSRTGESWVACGDDGRIVGFALIEPNPHGRHYAENEVLDLRWVGVGREHRGQGVFTRLIGLLQARLLPVTARVGVQNRSRAAERLEKLGFRRTDGSGGEHLLQWQPGNP